MSAAFASLVAAVQARGLHADLLAPGRVVEAADVPHSVSATLAVSDGMNLPVWRQRYGGAFPELMMMSEFLGEERARAFITMSGEYVARFGEPDPYWEATWWPVLSFSPKDVVAVDTETGEVWFSYSEAGIKEVIASSLDVYWSACARWVENIWFDTVQGLWERNEGYRGCEGPWDPKELGTGFTTTQFPSGGE